MKTTQLATICGATLLATTAAVYTVGTLTQPKVVEVPETQVEVVTQQPEVKTQPEVQEEETLQVRVVEQPKYNNVCWFENDGTYPGRDTYPEGLENMVASNCNVKAVEYGKMNEKGYVFNYRGTFAVYNYKGELLANLRLSGSCVPRVGEFVTDEYGQKVTENGFYIPVEGSEYTSCYGEGEARFSGSRYSSNVKFNTNSEGYLILDPGTNDRMAFSHKFDL